MSSTETMTEKSTVIPPEHKGKQKNLNALVAVATLGALAFGFDTGVISGAIPFMELPFSQGGLELTSTTTGIVTASLLLGAAFGGLGFGKFADAKGRRRTIMILAILFIIGALGTSFAPSVAVMVTFRIVLGLAVGGASAIVPVFIGELAPTAIRGTLVARNELTIVTGQLLAYVSNAAIGTALPDHHHTWRIMLLICTIPAVGLFLGTFYLTESPRWLIGKGYIDKARETLWQLRKDCSEEEISAEHDELVAHVHKMQGQTKGSLSELLAVPWIRRISIIGVLLAFFSQMTGINAVVYYTPTILIHTGLGTQAALIGTIGNGVVSVAAVAFGSMVLLPRMRRRPHLLIGQIGVTCALTAIGLAFALLPEGSTFRSYTILLLILVFMFFMQGFIAVIFWLMLAEIFPLKVRGRVMGIAVFMNWTANFLISLTFPILEQHLHGNVFFIFAVINFAIIFFYYRAIPETKGKSLEELEEHFAANTK